MFVLVCVLFQKANDTFDPTLPFVKIISYLPFTESIFEETLRVAVPSFVISQFSEPILARLCVYVCVWGWVCVRSCVHMHACMLGHSVVSNSLGSYGQYSPWNFPGQNTGVGSLSLLQGIFPTQGSNPDLPHYRQILYQLSHKGSPRILEWVAYPHRRWIFLTQGSNRGLLHCKWILFQMSY